MKGVAAAKTFDAHPYSAESAVRGDGFGHVVGTGRIEAARGGQEGRNESLVAFQEDDQDSLHREKSRPVSRHRSSNGAVAAVLRGLKIKAQFGGALAS